MSDIRATSSYLNKISMTLPERLALDARAEGLSLTVGDRGITLTGGLHISTFEGLATVLSAVRQFADARNIAHRAAYDANVRANHGEAIERRAQANKPWPTRDHGIARAMASCSPWPIDPKAE